MNGYQLFVGIDISKNSLDVCLLEPTNASAPHYLKVSNDAAGIKTMLAAAAKTKVPLSQVLFCMEDTGVYGVPLCSGLQAKEASYAVVPAIHIQRSRGLKRGKTDKTDARDIALYASTHQHLISLYQLPEPDMVELRLLLSERDKLLKAIALFDSSAEAFGFVDKKMLSRLKKHNTKTSALLAKQLKELEKTILELVAHNQQIEQQSGLLQSIPGIGIQTALQLISYSRCFSSFSNWRQMACYAGVAPFPYQSGSSVRGRTKVSHYAQKKLKALLNMAALSAKRHDPELRAYFERKVAEGKNKMSVVNAIRCKLLARAFAVINRNSPFVNLQKFSA